MIESPLEVPTRTPLYPVAPILGVDRESLTSYVMRLAQAHGTDCMGMVRWLKQFYPQHRQAAAWLRALSGTGSIARQGAVLIAENTGYADLHGLTLLPVQLFVRDCWDDRSKWCPDCISAGVAARRSFIPLKWSVRGYDICLMHHRHLEIRCGCGYPNQSRLSIANCDKCGLGLHQAEDSCKVSEQDEGYQRSVVIDEFLRYLNELPHPAHQNRFIALSELIQKRASRQESRKGIGRGGERLFRPTMIDAAEIALQRARPIHELFSIDDASRLMNWPNAKTIQRSSDVDWSPVLEMAQQAALVGRPVTIEILQRRFSMDPQVLRVKLRRSGIAWQRVRHSLTPQERSDQETKRREDVLAEAKLWLQNGGSRDVKQFRKAMLQKLGSWFGRAVWTANYSRIFRSVLPDLVPVKISRRQDVNWLPIYEASTVANDEGRRPTFAQLAQRFGVEQNTLRTHFARNGLSVDGLAPRLKRDSRAALEAQRERDVAKVSRIWLDDGNVPSLATMTAAFRQSDYWWIGRRQYRRRYMEIFREAGGSKNNE